MHGPSAYEELICTERILYSGAVELWSCALASDVDYMVSY